MKIFIDKVLNETVYISTDYGRGKGVWKGENKPTEKEYFVEFDIDTIYNYSDITISEAAEYQIKICAGKVYLTLLLLEYDELGCATFRFGNCIIEIETNYDKRFLELKNVYVIIAVETLNIYDENI